MGGSSPLAVAGATPAGTCLPCKNACVPQRPSADPISLEGPPGPQLGDWNLLRSFLAVCEPQDVVVPPRAFVAGFDREPMPVAAALHGAPPAEPLRFRLRSDSALAREAAVESGYGLGMYFVDIAAERPGLQRVLADRVRLPQEVWLCAHDEVRRSSRMRLVWDLLASALEARFRGGGAAAGRSTLPDR
jgi:hypothetical protein